MKFNHLTQFAFQTIENLAESTADNLKDYLDKFGLSEERPKSSQKAHSTLEHSEFEDVMDERRIQLTTQLLQRSLDKTL